MTVLDARMEAQIEASKEAREKDRVAADERMRVQMEESKKAREELLRKQIGADKSGSEDQERMKPSSRTYPLHQLLTTNSSSPYYNFLCFLDFTVL